MTKAERTKQMIIEQAAPIFNRKGIAGTSVDDVLAAAKVAKGCLYGHFASKEELSYASADYLLKKLAEKRDSVMGKETTAKGKVFAFMDLNKDPMNSLFVGGCPILNLSVEADDTNPVIKQKIQTIIKNAAGLLVGALREGIRTGEFSDRLDPEEYAMKMFAAIEGGNMICLAMSDSKYMTSIIKSLRNELESYRTT